MTRVEYDILQTRFSRKLGDMSGKRGEGYDDAIRACKSILHDLYEEEEEREAEKDKRIRELKRQLESERDMVYKLMEARKNGTDVRRSGTSCDARRGVED